ncbi:ESX secretion system protein EccC (Type VII secretion system protein EccC) (T7SS protein EccC) [Durusdinium trenchii]|uniref:ESX secretion system protein EccC (Type VII secretion system protein EccC) (T7SS protein EccC) n=1 Tax=Durusdinium trenchii TaxID=1381693 RepID=A0ABP0LGN8_9DINO
MRDLQRLANERQLEEERIAREHDQAKKAAADKFAERTGKSETQYKQQTTEQEESHNSRVESLQAEYEQNRTGAQGEYKQIRDQTEAKYNTTVRTAKEEKKQAVWQALAVFDASKNNPREALAATQQQLSGQQAHIDQLHADVEEILRTRRLWRDDFLSLAPAEVPAPAETEKPKSIEVAEALITGRIDSARNLVSDLQNSRSSQLFEGFTPFAVPIAVWLVLLVVLGFVVGWPNWPIWLAGSVVAAVVLCGLGGLLLRKRLTSWAKETYSQFAAETSAARGAIDLAVLVARDKSRRDAAKLIETRDKDLAEAETTARTTLADIESWKESTLADAHKKYPALLTELKEANQRDTANTDSEHRSTMLELREKHDAENKEAKVAREAALEAARKQKQSDWQAMSEKWFAGFEAICSELDQMKQRCERLFPDWNATDYAAWPKPTEPTEAIQFGASTLDLAKVKHAVSSSPELRPQVTSLELPTLVTLREQPSLVASADGDGRAVAVELLQTLMVRYLTAMPPGKVRFTICDPVSLGESFSSFMHLADHDEGLINGRIWSESRDIDEQLTRLTAHMETILQKYLRNEYASIHEYNEQAGEVAEPFQVLTIANFPHGFSDTAARRLLSLVAGGPRCGIYVLLSHDRKQRMPNDFAMDDLVAPSVFLDWVESAGLFVWRYPAFEHMPLALPAPIESDALVRLIKQAGKEAKDSIRVEVPFEVVAPEEDKLWTGKCDRELAIPVGRAGANRLQYVRLGKGTAQHLLVAGKTGSGKSTFLHALVTSGAMHFSPDELRFYLVDFKKGVEFKSYATHNLPHAEVIAIESEREFGLSVLERLDEELRRRGEKFRSAGVQSLGDYRTDHPDDPMPRVLLVVDEFQELFVEDDKLAQEAGLLLDRLVRQGRAFGMHVLLGSQTLSGAYSLARSTLGQMAVRVALQCSEADAHLILSDERNQAARFLSRPGEAIYNDQNGLVSGNQPFQVVWLPDRERASHLAEVDELRAERGLGTHEAIVFEGNAPADPLSNLALASLLAGDSVDTEVAAKSSTPPTAWLGSAVAIKPPTSVTFAPHGGSNLLVVGQQPAAALGVMSTAVISLAAAEPKAKFYVMDGTRPGEVGEGLWQRVASAVGEAAEMVEQRNVPDVLQQVTTELTRRDTEGDDSAPPIFLVIHNASRLRDLRKSEDDFSFSMDRDKPPAPDKQLAEILKNGPQWGIHALVWCDGYNAVTRLFDRLALREFEMRVVFQMSAADSSNLLDTPAASQLSPHRALVYNDETGEAEKFRPYGLPTDEWLQQASRGLQRRHVVDRA